ncbi:hypothetical protein ACN6LM_002597 [Streptomyces sp. SAS_281]|uniref:hypothetical protein n=1 Tax=Streptomyces sp. SAS_281 TaxID=3412744 RepID=UPI00403D1D9B
MAAFTQAHAEQIPVTCQPLDQVAALNGWSAEGSSPVSPDLYCQIEQTRGADGVWRDKHVYFEKEPLATFTRRNTPEHLVGNFFAHLASPIAVERAFADIPLNARYEHSGLITTVRRAAINPQVAHALAELGRPHRR